MVHLKMSVFSNMTRNILKNRLISQAGGVFILKILYVGLSLLIALLLGRFLGPKGLGAYSFSISTVQVLLIPTIFGLPQVAVRETAVNFSQQRWSILRGLISWCNKSVFYSSLIFTGIGVVVCLLFEHRDPFLARTLLISVFSLPFLAQIRIRQSIMQGFKRIVLGNAPEFLIEPILILAIIVVTGFFFRGLLTPQLTLIGYDCSVIICFCIGVILLIRTMPKDIWLSDRVFNKKRWFRSALLLLWATAMMTINNRMDSVMLGVFWGAEEVGTYTAANKAAQLIPFGLIAINVSIKPVIAEVYEKKEWKKIQRLLTYSSRGGLIFAIPCILVFIFLGKIILNVFGSDFVIAYRPLLILSVGQLINNAAGCVGAVLINCHKEKEAAISIAVGAGANVLLNMILIPIFKVEGAAIATGVSMIIWNVLMIVFVRRKLKLRAGPI